jgi:hypothetical protein
MKKGSFERAKKGSMDFALRLTMPRTYVQAIDFLRDPRETRSAFIRRAIREAIELEIRRRRQTPPTLNEAAE